MNSVVNELVGYININPIIPVIIGGILTFLGGFIGNLLLQRSQRKNDREHLSATFAGDIYAILSIIKERNYEGELKRALYRMRKLKRALDRMGKLNKDLDRMGELNKILDRMSNDNKRVVFARRIEGDYLMVYKQNVDKLGVLESSLAGQIVIFYTYITVLLEDNREAFNTKVNPANLKYLAVRHEETLNLLRKTVKFGEEVLNTLAIHTNFINEHKSTQLEQTKDDSPVPPQN